jgi:Ca2+-binding RTX toxin-like protein
LIRDQYNNLYLYNGDSQIELLESVYDAHIYTGSGNDSIIINTNDAASIYVDSGDGQDDIRVNNISRSASIYLSGGSGLNTYYLPSDQGVSGYKVTINNTTTNQTAGTIILGNDIKSDGLTLGLGSLLINFGEMLQVHLESFDPQQVLEGPRDIDRFEFSDGTVMTYEELVSHGFDHQGSDADDQLIGTSVTDRIIANAGNDYIQGGRGDDALTGGLGDDIYVYNLGDGVDTIYDSLEPRSGNLIRFGDNINPEDINITNTESGLVIKVGTDGDAIILKNPDPVDGKALDTIAFLEFIDGSRINFQELVAAQLASSAITGTRGSDHLDGTVANDIINGLSGKDTIFAGEGDDTLIGGAGQDTLHGEAGDDVFLVTGSDKAYDRFNGGDGFDQILGSDDNDIFRLHIFDPSNSIEKIDGKAGVNTISGTRGRDLIDLSATLLSHIDHIDAGPSQDTVIATSLSDYLIGGRGSDWLEGGIGNDTYFFSKNNGRDTILDQDSEVNHDQIQFAEGISHDQLRFRKSHHDLDIRIVGGGTQVTVKNWFLGAQYQIESIHAGDGYVLLNTQIEQMIQAIASFDRPSSGELKFTQAVLDRLEPVLAVDWQAA